MKTRFELLASVAATLLAATASPVHETFNAHREEILSSGIAVFDNTVFLSGTAQSPRKWGDAVGWSKAEDAAKWHLGDRYLASAQWQADATEDEKKLAWKEYRATHPNRFGLVGLQRIWSKKTPPDGYTVVLAVPEEFVNMEPPSVQELGVAVARVREMRRLAEEAKLKAEAEAARIAAEKAERERLEKEAAERRAGARKIHENGIIQQQQLDEDMVF